MPRHKTFKIGNEEVVLTEREQMFCEEYLGDSNRNATQAAIKAGYSKKTARNIANHNLSKVHIQKYLEYKTMPILKKHGITQERVLEELAKIAFVDVTDYVNDDYSMKPKNELEPKQRSALSQIKVRQEDKGDKGKETTVEFKTWSKDKALMTLAEMTGLIDRKGDVNIQNNTQNNYYSDANKHIQNQ